MVQRSKRSMSPQKAREMQAVTRDFHYTVRRWCGEIPISSEIYIVAAGSNEPDTFHGLYRMDIDAGEE
ncbi:hypothetical protein LJR009_002300 [Bosea sp. LjRoot9]|uniref:hypothetical protein n=1 Tax=Bosea sp. LjRoot9 TaxID=3342341 RepID=UPI003ECF22B7